MARTTLNLPSVQAQGACAPFALACHLLAVWAALTQFLGPHGLAGGRACPAINVAILPAGRAR
jgi:hypothetical protein